MTDDRWYDGKPITKKLAFEDARQKIASYCAYQERAHIEVEVKLYSYGLSRDEVEELLAWLITENFVNEERYATSYAGGKFRVKRWGRLKIMRYLEQKKISEYSINKALDQIDYDDYCNTLDQLIIAASPKVKKENIFEYRHKLSRSLINKGYEPDLVWERLKLLVSDEEN
jgi:regulatory protein